MGHDDPCEGRPQDRWATIASLLSVAAVGVLVALVLVVTLTQGLRLVLEVLAR